VLGALDEEQLWPPILSFSQHHGDGGLLALMVGENPRGVVAEALSDVLDPQHASRIADTAGRKCSRQITRGG
jgi:hypothetical protein